MLAIARVCRSKVSWEAIEEFQARSDMISVIFTNYELTYYVDSSETRRNIKKRVHQF